MSTERFRPRTEDTLGLGTVLAVAAHLLLVAALFFGMHWRTVTPAVAEAEVWAEVPTAAAPSAEPAPPPQPAPEPAPAPAAEKAEPPPPVAQAEPEPVPAPEAEVPSAPEPKKKKKAKPKKEAPPTVVAKAEPKKVEPKKVEPKKAEAKKEKPPEKEKPPKRETPAKAAPEPKETFITDKPVASKKPATATPASSTAAAGTSTAERESQRKAALQRMMKDLGGLGTSEKSAGPSANYVGKLRARIIPNITFLMDEGSGNPTAFVEIRCAPDGTILSKRLLESSGSPAWDKAVLDGIEKTRSLPFDEKGRLPDTVFQIGISPRDR